MTFIPTWLIYLAIGGGLGAALGCFGKCQSGTCPLTANWRRGAVYGAVVAALVYLVSGRGLSASEMNQSTAHVTRLTEADFEREVGQSTQPMLVDFYATWCGPCQRLAPVVDQLAGEYAGKIKFFKVNVDESPKLAQRFQVDGIPMLLFFKNGQRVNASVGWLSAAELKLKLASLLATNSLSGNPPR